MTSLLSLTADMYEGIKVIKLNGVLTEISGFQIEQPLKKYLEKQSIILDFSDVTLVSMAGLKYVVELSVFARENGTRLIVLYPGEEVRSLAETVDWYHLLIFAENPDECIVKIKHYT